MFCPYLDNSWSVDGYTLLDNGKKITHIKWNVPNKNNNDDDVDEYKYYTQKYNNIICTVPIYFYQQ